MVKVALGVAMSFLEVIHGKWSRMFYFDNQEHYFPHIHIAYADQNAVLSITYGVLIAGKFPGNKLKLVLAWVEIHKDELMAD